MHRVPSGRQARLEPQGHVGPDSAQGPAGPAAPAISLGATTWGKVTTTFAQPAFLGASVDVNHIADRAPDLVLSPGVVTVTISGNHLIDLPAYSPRARRFALMDSGAIIDGSSGVGAGNETASGSGIVALAAGDVVSV